MRFFLVDAEMLSKVISQLKPATCFLDPIPTSFFRTVWSFLDEDVLNTVNYSLQTGVFPTAFKTAMVTLLLKKNKLDHSILIVFNQLNDFINRHNMFEIYQSGFHANDSTETALITDFK